MSSTPEADRVKAIAEQWKDLQAKLPPSVNVSGGTVDTISIGDSIERVADMVEKSETSNADPIAKAVHWPNISSQIGNLQNYVQQIVNNAGAQHVVQNQAQNIINTIWSLRSTVFWLLPNAPVNGSGKQDLHLTELVASAEKVLDLRRQAGIAAREVQEKISVLNKNEGDVKKLVASIEGYERTASNARSNAEASEAATKENAEALGRLLAEDTERSDSLTTLLEEFQSKRTIVDETLEGASKIALANSFHLRRRALNQERWGWVAGFVIGIILLVVIGVFLVPKVVSEANIPSSQKYYEIVGHVLLLGPVVWLTWFSARKAGQTMRLAEDYGFKEAAAHAFVGYKREMSDDTDMLHQLRQYAIQNFGSDPQRVLSHDEAASPLHAIIETLLERVDRLKPDETMKAVGEIAKALGQLGPGK
jgi:hypothetical protein